MSRRPAPHTQAEIARVLRAAKQVGVAVEIKIGDMVVTVDPTNPNKTVDHERVIKL
jgi:hypothetical protein